MYSPTPGITGGGSSTWGGVSTQSPPSVAVLKRSAVRDGGCHASTAAGMVCKRNGGSSAVGIGSVQSPPSVAVLTRSEVSVGGSHARIAVGCTRTLRGGSSAATSTEV